MNFSARFSYFSFLLISFFFLICLSLFFFWQTLVGTLILKGANQYCVYYFGVPLESQGIHRDPSSKCWTIKKPRIVRSDATLEGESLVFDWGLYPFNQETAIKLEVFGSHIVIGQETADLSAFFKKLIPKNAPYWFFHLNSQFDLHQGVVVWKDKKGERKSALFEIVALSNKEKKIADLTFFLEKKEFQKEKKQNTFQFHISQELNQPFEAGFTFYQVDAQKMFCVLETLGSPFREVCRGWTVLKGNIDGNLSFFIPHEFGQRSSTSPLALGKATISDLSIEHSQAKITGEIGECVIELQVEGLDKKQWKKDYFFPAVQGRLEVVKEGAFSFYQKGDPLWKIEEVKGGVFFKQNQTLFLDISGKCFSPQEQFTLKIEGEGSWQKAKGVVLDASLYLQSPHQERSSFHMCAKPSSQERHLAEIHLQNFGPKEFKFFQGIFGRNSFWGEQIDMLQGDLGGSGTLLFRGLCLEELRFDQMEVRELRLAIPSSQWSCSAEQIVGRGALDFSKKDLLQGIEADFSLSQGSFTTLSSSGFPFCFEEISTNISFKKGVIQKSEIQGRLGKLQGTATVDWQSKEQPLQISFSGPAEELTPFFPVVVQPQAKRVLADELLFFSAEMLWEEGGAQIKGDIHFSCTVPFKSEEALSFGFHLEKSSEKFWKKWPVDRLAFAYWKVLGGEVLQTILPPVASPAALFESKWIRSELGIGGLVLRKGWFLAHSIPLEKYLTPFLFRNHEMVLKGVGSFQGYFDHNQLAVCYEAQDVLLDNDYLTIASAHISDCSHYFNFEEGTHFGSLPLKRGTYIEKTHGFRFSNVEAAVTFVNHEIHLSKVKTECEGITFSGEADIDFGLPRDGIFEVEIRTSHIKGSLSQLQTLCRPFFPSTVLSGVEASLWSLFTPLKGEFLLQEEGGKFHFTFSPEGYQTEADFTGVVTKGSFPLEEMGVKLEDAGMEFACHFDSKEFRLEMSQISARISPYEPFSFEENYRLVGDYFRCIYLREEKRPSAFFDVWVGDRSRDLMRLVGSAESEENNIVVNVDTERTHLGHIHPTYFQLVFNDVFQVEQFQCICDLYLSRLKDHFIPSDWSAIAVLLKIGNSLLLGNKEKNFFSMKKWGKEIAAFKKAKGNIRFDLSYEGKNKEFNYGLKGEGLAWGEYEIANMEFLGVYREGVWNIHHLVKDRQKMSGLVKRHLLSWEVSNWLIDDGEAVRLYLDGNIQDRGNGFQARIRDMEIDLARLKGSPELDPFLIGCSPHGILKGSGELKWEWGKGGFLGRIEAILDVALFSWDAKGMFFQDAKNVSCHFISDRGVTFRNLNTSLMDPELKNTFATIKIEKMEYEFSSGQLVFDDFYFRVSAHHLPQFSNQLKKSFPYFFSSALAEVIENAKLEGKMEGTATFEMTPPYLAFKLSLKEGRYHFLNAEHDLSQCVVEYDPFEFKVVSRYFLGDRWVWLYGRSFSPILEQGDLILTEISPDKPIERGQDALYIKWENHLQTGLSIRSVEGVYQGLTVQLERDLEASLSETEMALTGTVAIDGRRTKGFFPKTLEMKLSEWQIGPGYRLRGKWRFQKKGGTVSDYSNKLHFLGILEGEQFFLKGYQFDSFLAHLEYTPKTVQVRHLVARDLAGELKMEQMDCVRKENGDWDVKIPEIEVFSFIPSLLREAGMLRPSIRKPLVIKKLVLKDFQGPFSDGKDLRGRGELYFINRSKKLFQNTIFQIPSDLLSRIGLDLSVLTPVIGTIQYQIRDGKIYLTKFKDIYSEGKLSKFYLSGTGYPSYLEFDGKLHVQVKMRQHNLLFKLAELFTVNIQGELGKPVYSLHQLRGKEIAGAEKARSSQRKARAP